MTAGVDAAGMVGHVAQESGGEAVEQEPKSTIASRENASSKEFPTHFQCNQLEHPQALVVLILGIAGVTVAPPIAPIAWALGSRTLRQIDAAPHVYGRRDFVLVGKILGVVGTILFGLVLLLIFYFVRTAPSDIVS